MITPSELTHPAVRDFVTAFNDHQVDAVHATVTDDFAATSGPVRNNARRFMTVRSAIAIHHQDAEGLTVRGLYRQGHQNAPVRWAFTPRDGKIAELVITKDDDFPSGFFNEADPELERCLGRGTPYRTDSDGKPRPLLALRREKLGSHLYVTRFSHSGLWVNTGEKADGDVHRSYRSPSSGDHDDRSRVSSVSSHLDLRLGWDGDDHQMATVSYWAKPYYWDAIKWCPERLRLDDSAIPTITGTLTLTGPGDTIVSTENITINGGHVPYERTFTRTIALADTPSGTHTLTFTQAVKTGGTGTNKGADKVELSDHTLTFTVGG
ncbi:nuclear transport factor 2 family protein [Streptomyces sp. NPDC004126]|uniref:nuclear transport factor 2 family protein n=1 Tax=Streptomyces sp. NPDC004126 TaxID=3390695 RepID=UPI003D08717C